MSIKIENKGTNQKDTIALLTNRKEIKRWGQVRQGKRQEHETAIHDGGLKKV